jgi:hypothetical protein
VIVLSRHLMRASADCAPLVAGAPTPSIDPNRVRPRFPRSELAVESRNSPSRGRRPCCATIVLFSIIFVFSCFTSVHDVVSQVGDVGGSDHSRPFQLDVPTAHTLEGADTVAYGIPQTVVRPGDEPVQRRRQIDDDSWLRLLSCGGSVGHLSPPAPRTIRSPACL